MTIDLGAIAADLGVDFSKNASEVQQYLNRRALSLQGAVGQPGYEVALRAEGMNVALFATGLAIDEADKIDQTILNVLTTVLAIAIRAL